MPSCKQSTSETVVTTLFLHDYRRQYVCRVLLALTHLVVISRCKLWVVVWRYQLGTEAATVGDFMADTGPLLSSVGTPSSASYTLCRRSDAVPHCGVPSPFSSKAVLRLRQQGYQNNYGKGLCRV